MIRYSNLLEEIYSKTNFEIHTISPTKRFSCKIQNSRIRKFVIYVEKYPIFMLRLAFLQLGTKFTHVHFLDHSDSLISIAIWRRMKMIITVHDQFAILASLGRIPEVKLRMTGKIYQRANKRAMNNFSHYLCVSLDTRRIVCSLYPSKTYLTFYNPIDSNFIVEKISYKDKIESGNTYALIVNNSHWRKNRLASIKVWYELRKVISSSSLRLIIIGNALEDIETNFLHSYQLHEYVQVIEGVEDLNLVEYYRRALVLIFMTKFEGFGYPIAEANSCGTLAVASNIPVISEVSGDLNVLISDSLDGVDWAKVNLEISSQCNVDKAQLYIRENFSMDSIQKSLESIYSEFL